MDFTTLTLRDKAKIVGTIDMCLSVVWVMLGSVLVLFMAENDLILLPKNEISEEELTNGTERNRTWPCDEIIHKMVSASGFLSILVGFLTHFAACNLVKSTKRGFNKTVALDAAKFWWHLTIRFLTFVVVFTILFVGSVEIIARHRFLPKFQGQLRFIWSYGIFFVLLHLVVFFRIICKYHDELGQTTVASYQV